MRQLDSSPALRSRLRCHNRLPKHVGQGDRPRLRPLLTRRPRLHDPTTTILAAIAIPSGGFTPTVGNVTVCAVKGLAVKMTTAGMVQIHPTCMSSHTATYYDPGNPRGERMQGGWRGWSAHDSAPSAAAVRSSTPILSFSSCSSLFQRFQAFVSC